MGYVINLASLPRDLVNPYYFLLPFRPVGYGNPNPNPPETRPERGSTLRPRRPSLLHRCISRTTRFGDKRATGLAPERLVFYVHPASGHFGRLSWVELIAGSYGNQFDSCGPSAPAWPGQSGGHDGPRPDPPRNPSESD